MNLIIRPAIESDLPELEKLQQRRVGGPELPFILPTHPLSRFGTVALNGKLMAYAVVRLSGEAMLAADSEADPQARVEAVEAMLPMISQLMRSQGYGELHAFVPEHLHRWADRLEAMGWEKRRGTAMVLRFK